MELVKRRLYWSRGTPKLYNWRCCEKTRHSRRPHDEGLEDMATAKEYPEPPETGRGRKDPLIRFQRGHYPANASISDTWPPELRG